MPKSISPNWTLIEIDYRGDNLSMAQIAQKHKVSLSTISKARQRSNWPSRNKLNRADTKANHIKAARKIRIPPRKLLIGRMFVVLEKQIERMENIMPEHADDKEIALLGQLVRTLEKLVELDCKHQGLAKDTLKAEAKNSRQMQDLRTKINQRMHQLEAE